MMSSNSMRGHVSSSTWHWAKRVTDAHDRLDHFQQLVSLKNITLQNFKNDDNVALANSTDDHASLPPCLQQNSSWLIHFPHLDAYWATFTSQCFSWHPFWLDWPGSTENKNPYRWGFTHMTHGPTGKSTFSRIIKHTPNITTWKTVTFIYVFAYFLLPISFHEWLSLLSLSLSIFF